MSGEFWRTMSLTFTLAAITTGMLILIGIPLACWIAYTKNRLRPFIETVVSMPLVLPPSVLGFYLLMAFSPDYFFGSMIESLFNVRLVFSFEGIVAGSILFSLPFMVHPLQSGFSSVPQQLTDVSYTLGKSKLQTLFRVILPNMKQSILTGVVLTFAHTIGEFGVVLMIGGNIPGETRLASIAIYDEVESLNYAMANQYAIVLFLVSFAVLLVVYALKARGVRAI